jgi:flagellar basal-body rod modification protein FlgD
MPVSEVNNVPSLGGTNIEMAQESLGKQDFLSLLTTQLEHQDPLNPMDSTAFTAQLAQFSSLEQMTNMNEKLEYLLMYQASLNNAQTASFIGKTIKANGNSVGLDEGVAGPISYELPAEASSVSVEVHSPDGQLVRVINAGSQEPGEHQVDWDGRDQDGNVLPDGTYTFDVVAKDMNGEDLRATPYIEGEVSGLVFKDGSTSLVVDGQEIPVGQVLRVYEPETEA